MTSQNVTNAACIHEIVTNGSDAANWFVVNDNVMGGRSIGGVSVAENALLFSGSINTNGGGFSSIRRKIDSNDLSTDDAPVGVVELELKSDGRDYKFLLQTDALFRERPVSFQAKLQASGTSTWEKVSVPLSSFIPTFRGRILFDWEINPERINQVGIILADRVDGPFDFAIKTVRFCPATLRRT